MDNLAPRILQLVGRLAGGWLVARAAAPPRDRASPERAYRQVLTRWFELTALGPALTRLR
ncbi:MAG: hypothetical protein HY726_01150 [Candidatus Rokubacteria bacterium]|nr:hypothetical protein [Candidatus Rokubacteria bacterium]